MPGRTEGPERGFPPGARPPFGVPLQGEVVGKGMEGLVIAWGCWVSLQLVCSGTVLPRLSFPFPK